MDYNKFQDYLREVIAYYHKYGSLKRFSNIAKQYKITAIPIEVFYEYNLQNVASGSVPEISVCKEIYKSIRGRRAGYQSLRVRTFVRDNGEKTIIHIPDPCENWFDVALNFRGYADERDRIWINDSADSVLQDCKEVATTAEDYEALIDNLARIINYYLDEKDLVSFGNYLLSDERNDKIDSKSESKTVSELDLQNWRSKYNR